ncbi:hypothetical protein LXL04_024823 [Taraxacum kok-saghyz]
MPSRHELLTRIELPNRPELLTQAELPTRLDLSTQIDLPNRDTSGFAILATFSRTTGLNCFFNTDTRSPNHHSGILLSSINSGIPPHRLKLHLDTSRHGL